MTQKSNKKSQEQKNSLWSNSFCSGEAFFTRDKIKFRRIFVIPVSGESTTPASTGILPMLKAVRGQKFFELSNHLGNVLVTVTDQKIWTVDAANGNYYAATVASATDYYAFGEAIQGRKLQPQGNRYGFNGKENDNDWGTALIQDYGFRIYSGASVRFYSVDPLRAKYPELTPFQFASNSPISGIDLDGLEYLSANKCFLDIMGGSLYIKPAYCDGKVVDVFIPTGSSTPTEACFITSITVDGATATLPQAAVFMPAISPEPVQSGHDSQDKQALQLDASSRSFETSTDPNAGMTALEKYPVRTRQDGLLDRRYYRFNGGANPSSRNIPTTQAFGKFQDMQRAAPMLAGTKGIAVVGLAVQAVELGNTAISSWNYFVSKTEYDRQKNVILAKVFQDVQYAINNNLIDKKFQNPNDLGAISNFLLQGKTTGMSPELLRTAVNVFNQVTTYKLPIFPPPTVESSKPTFKKYNENGTIQN